MRWKGVPGAKHPRQAIASAAKVSRLDERPASIATGSGFYSLPPIGQIVFTLKKEKKRPARGEPPNPVHPKGLVRIHENHPH
jgi:hypothetical protein